MPGRRLHSFHEGDRSEYLLTFFLSSIAAVTSVPRQEDYGLDLLCALTRQEGSSLYIEKEFSIQAKSASEEHITYGGFDKNGTWKKWEIEWLYRQTHPLFIASVDRDKWKIQLFATSRRWFVRFFSGWPFEVKLSLEESPEIGTPERFSNEAIEGVTNDVGDGKRWMIPLGRPIVAIDIQQLEDPDFRKEIYDCIDRWIDLERKNIQNYLLGVPVSVEFVGWDTNKIPMGCLFRTWSKDNIKYYPYYNPTPGHNIDQVLAAITAPALALALNSASQGNHEELEAVKSVLELLAKRAFLDPKILDYVKKLIDNI